MSESQRVCKHPNCNNPLDNPRKEFCGMFCKNDFHRLARIKGEKIMNQGSIKAALLENSGRLQRVAKYLSDGQPHSTRDIIMNCDVCAVSTIIEELRHDKNGFEIECKQVRQYVWEYTMVGGFHNLLRIV